MEPSREAVPAGVAVVVSGADVICRHCGSRWPAAAGEPSTLAARARSSAGQSSRLIIGRSLVRVQAGPNSLTPTLRMTALRGRCEPCRGDRIERKPLVDLTRQTADAHGADTVSAD